MSHFTYRVHGGIPMFNYKGLITSQAIGVEKAFTKLAEYVALKPFDVILELGSDHGGLTNLLADHTISNNAKIHAFDINKDVFTNLNPDKITFHHMDIYANFPFIHGIINSSKRALVLCDGGNKSKEFGEVAPFIRPGDIIMAHDYSPDKEAFEQNKSCGRWNWWEFNDMNIPNCGLFKPLDCFDEYVWCIREKQ